MDIHFKKLCVDIKSKLRKDVNLEHLKKFDIYTEKEIVLEYKQQDKEGIKYEKDHIFELQIYSYLLGLTFYNNLTFLNKNYELFKKSINSIENFNLTTKFINMKKKNTISKFIHDGIYKDYNLTSCFLNDFPEKQAINISNAIFNSGNFLIENIKVDNFLNKTKIDDFKNSIYEFNNKIL